MGRFRVLAGLLSVVLLVFMTPAAAGAGPVVLLGFGDQYVLEGAPRTHRGADLAFSEGDVAPAFADGEISFAGRIPSDDGSTVFAVTIATGDGLVTIHPLAECWVSAGGVVSKGEGIGTVAASGDASSSDPHLHLSTRVDGSYVDPACLLASDSPLAEAAPVTTPAPATADSPHAVTPTAVLTVAAPAAIGPNPTLIPVEPIVPTASRSVDLVHLGAIESAGIAPATGDAGSAVAASGTRVAFPRRADGLDVPDIAPVSTGALTVAALGLGALAASARRRERALCMEGDR